MRKEAAAELRQNRQLESRARQQSPRAGSEFLSPAKSRKGTPRTPNCAPGLVLAEYSVEKSFELGYVLERYGCPSNPNQSLFPEAGQETRDRLAGNPAQLTYLLLCQVHAQS